jgi:hypothetical protein
LAPGARDDAGDAGELASTMRFGREIGDVVKVDHQSGIP